MLGNGILLLTSIGARWRTITIREGYCILIIYTSYFSLGVSKERPLASLFAMGTHLIFL